MIEAIAETKDAQVIDPEVVLTRAVLIAEIVVTTEAEQASVHSLKEEHEQIDTMI